MITRLLAIAIAALGLGACASAGPPADSSPAVAAEPTADAPVDESVTAAQSAVAPEEESIEVIEVPTVAQTEIPVEAPDPDDRICRREIRTGTHRAVRVCRTRAEIESMERESKDTFRGMHEAQRHTDRAEQIRRQ